MALRLSGRHCTKTNPVSRRSIISHFLLWSRYVAKITLIKDKVLSDNYFILRNITYDLTRSNGEVIRHKREVYDRGNGATILLYNPEKKTVVLIRQFRVATRSMVMKAVN